VRVSHAERMAARGTSAHYPGESFQPRQEKESVHQGEEEEAVHDRTGEVELFGEPLAPFLPVHEEQEDDDNLERDNAIEDTAPPEVIGHHATEHRACREPDVGDRHADPEHRAPLFRGYAAVSAATEVEKIMAFPSPWSIRKPISRGVDQENAQRRVAAVKMMIPGKKTRRMPWMSASLPMGMRKIADARTNDVGIHPRRTASAPSSAPMAGRAILTDELMNGVRNDATSAMKRMRLRSAEVLPVSGDALMKGIPGMPLGYFHRNSVSRHCISWSIFLHSVRHAPGNDLLHILLPCMAHMEGDRLQAP